MKYHGYHHRLPHPRLPDSQGILVDLPLVVHRRGPTFNLRERTPKKKPWKTETTIQAPRARTSSSLIALREHIDDLASSDGNLKFVRRAPTANSVSIQESGTPGLRSTDPTAQGVPKRPKLGHGRVLPYHVESRSTIPRALFRTRPQAHSGG